MKSEALAGRNTPLGGLKQHCVLGTPLVPPFPEYLSRLVVGMGCFWGAERLFWQVEGVYSTAVGYSGGITPHPTYEEVCSGQTGHTEAVLIIYDAGIVPLEALLKIFWEEHDPTQAMRQGNDRGTQYRTALYLDDDESLGARVRQHRYMVRRWQVQDMALSPPKSGKKIIFSMLKIIISNICIKTQTAIAGSQDVRFRQIFAFRLDLLWCLVYCAVSMTNLARFGHVGES